MNMTWKTILYLFLAIILLEVFLAGHLKETFHIGTNPETGKFSVWNSEREFSIQEQINEEFQPDVLIAEGKEEKAIYGSERVYEAFQRVFGQTHALADFKLIRMLLIIDVLWLLLALLLRSVIALKPKSLQVFFEMIYGFFENLVMETLGTHRKSYTPYITTIFLFIWTSNLIAMIPIPGNLEPTRNLNVTLGMGLIAVGFVQIAAIRAHGFWHYIKHFGEPMVFLAPLEVIGVVAKVVSISFRLFGNILGGSIIILVVSNLCQFVFLPVGLQMFFGLFVGTVQAFVFTMLSLTYLSIEIAE